MINLTISINTNTRFISIYLQQCLFQQPVGHTFCHMVKLITTEIQSMEDTHMAQLFLSHVILDTPDLVQAQLSVPLQQYGIQ